MDACAGRGEFIDVMQTIGILVIAVSLILTALRFVWAIDIAAKKVTAAIGQQQEIQQMAERMWKRIETVESQVRERHQILPTSQIKATLSAIGARLDRLEATHETPPDDH
jgi:hypothetical protein